MMMLSAVCRGIVYVSKHRASRYEHIASYLAEGRHDIVALQEVQSLLQCSFCMRARDCHACRCGARTTIMK